MEYRDYVINLRTKIKEMLPEIYSFKIAPGMAGPDEIVETAVDGFLVTFSNKCAENAYFNYNFVVTYERGYQLEEKLKDKIFIFNTLCQRYLIDLSAS